VGFWETWRGRARALKQETYAIYLACRDPRVPWYGRALAACVVGYALSPIDLILIPVGIALVLKTIPPVVMAESRERAAIVMAGGKPKNWIAAGIIVFIWIGLAIGGVALTVRFLR
jgi:hypothetical protein